MHLRGSLVDEALTVEGVEHGLTLTGIQRARRAPAAQPSVAPAAAVDTRTRAGRPRRRTLPLSPSWGSPPQWPASLDLVGLERFQGDPQELGNFFLEGDDRLRPLQAALEPPFVRCQGGLLPL